MVNILSKIESKNISTKDNFLLCFSTLTRNNSGPGSSVQLLLLPLFMSNFIGLAVARSLHYQFYVWYYHQVSISPTSLFGSLSKKLDRLKIEIIFFWYSRLKIWFVKLTASCPIFSGRRRSQSSWSCWCGAWSSLRGTRIHRPSGVVAYYICVT